MRAQINGTTLAYDLKGPKQAPLLVLVHGFPFDRGQWKAQVPALAKRWRVLSYDQRGLGKSALGPAPQLMEAYADDLLGLMDWIGVRRAAVAGLSMGGYVALRAVQKAPQRFFGLALCDTRAEADSDAAKLGRSAGLQTLRTRGLGAFADGMLPKLLSPAAFKRRPALVKGLRRLMLRQPLTGVANALVAMAGRTDSRELLGDLKLPVLCLVGEHDALSPPDLHRALRRAIPGAQLAVLKGAGHVSNWEAPQAFNAALDAWMAKAAAQA